MTENEKENFNEMIKERDLIESSLLNSIKELEELGIGPMDSVLDSEGYPRCDLDLYRVRALKFSIARQQNDFKAVMQKIEKLLPVVILAINHNFYNQEKDNLVSTLKPFARVGIVPTGTVAYLKGLCTNDLIIKFGCLTRENFKLDLIEFKHEINRLKGTEEKSTTSEGGKKILFIMIIRNSETKTIEIEIDHPHFSLGCQILLLQQ